MQLKDLVESVGRQPQGIEAAAIVGLGIGLRDLIVNEHGLESGVCPKLGNPLPLAGNRRYWRMADRGNGRFALLRRWFFTAIDGQLGLDLGPLGRGGLLFLDERSENFCVLLSGMLEMGLRLRKRRTGFAELLVPASASLSVLACSSNFSPPATASSPASTLAAGTSA